MSFKDIVKADIPAFFDPDEFAGRNSGASHTWDGVDILAVLDSNVVQSNNSTEYPAFPSGTLTVYVPVDAITRPKDNSVHRFDGMLYRIWDIKEEMGVYVIELIAGGP